MGPRRSSLRSVRLGQLLVTPKTLDIYKYLMSLVTLCTSTHCQCNESVHRNEQLLFTPFMTRDHE